MNSDDAGKAVLAAESPETFILRRVAGGDKNAFRECVEKHGGMIWSMAKHYAVSESEAETMTRKIFREIWKDASKFENAGCTERIFIRLVAYRHLRRDSKNNRENP